MAAPRLRRLSTQREMDNQIDDYITQGYELITRGDATALLRKKSWGSGGGHLLWFLLTFWFTLGIGNAIYAAIAHYNAEQVMLKIDMPEA